MSERDGRLRLQFTFTHPDDLATYGDQPFLYDEYELISTPGRTLVEYEELIGMSIPNMMNGVRQSETLADLAATWLSVRRLRPDVGEFEKYNPHSMMIKWERPGANVSGKDEEVPMSGPAPTVTLPTLPMAD